MVMVQLSEFDDDEAQEVDRNRRCRLGCWGGARRPAPRALTHDRPPLGIDPYNPSGVSAVCATGILGRLHGYW